MNNPSRTMINQDANSVNTPNSVSQFGYDQMLLKLVKNLNKFTMLQGGEGYAYLVDDNYVIKEYIVGTSDYKQHLFKTSFDKFCREIQSYANKGFSFPKIYAWLSMPTPRDNYGNQYPLTSYFILQERAKGRELFLCEPRDLYPFYCNKYNQETFELILEKKLGSQEYNQILSSYLADFIMINTYLEAMPNKVCEKLVADVYGQYITGNYSVPDVYGRNIFTNFEQTTIIDPTFSDRTKVSNEARQMLRGNFMTMAIIKMFSFNSLPKLYIHELISQNKISTEQLNKFENQLKECQKVCATAMHKFIQTVNKYTENAKITNKDVLQNITNLATGAVGKDNASTIINDIYCDFSL